jgi:hypothetical protein
MLVATSRSLLPYLHELRFEKALAPSCTCTCELTVASETKSSYTISSLFNPRKIERTSGECIFHFRPQKNSPIKFRSLINKSTAYLPVQVGCPHLFHSMLYSCPLIFL